jgi:serine/threonine protein kinase
MAQEYDYYEELEKIGNGAFGEVYRVKDIRSDTIRALKKLRIAMDHEENEKNPSNKCIPRVIFAEIEAMRQLDHPNVRVIHSTYYIIKPLRLNYKGIR